MSDRGEAMVLAALPAALLEARQGFRSDRRFARTSGESDAAATDAMAGLADPEAGEAQPDDPLHAAWAEGFAAGAAEARAAAEEQAHQDAAAREALAVALARLDAESMETLRRRLHAIVVALCEEALQPLALDQAALAARVERAASLLARADDERTIRLHPDDIACLSPTMRSDWHIVPDPALERGSVRVETATGGVEDGPGEWRRAIAEALAPC